MKAVIDEKGCIGCGLCTDICPSVFRMTKKTYAEAYVDQVPAKDSKDALKAQESCPVSVITISE